MKLLNIIFFLCFSGLMTVARANVMFFGDSLSDIGNNTWILTSKNRWDRPQLKGAPVTNRAQNISAKLWVNDLIYSKLFYSSEKFDLSHAASGTVVPKFRGDLNKLNIDWAWASAETGDVYLDDNILTGVPSPNDTCTGPGLKNPPNGKSCVPGLFLQVHEYIDALKALHQEPTPQTKIFIWAGGNDLFDELTLFIESGKLLELKKHLETVALKAASMGTKQASLADVAKAFGAAFEYFMAHGSRPDLPAHNIANTVAYLHRHHIPFKNIYVLTLPNISITPAAKQMQSAISTNFGAKMAALVPTLLSALSGAFTTRLEASLAIYPGVHIINMEAGLDRFKDKFKTLDSCSASDPSQWPKCQGYLFANAKHPTQAAHQAIAMYIKHKL